MKAFASLKGREVLFFMFKNWKKAIREWRMDDSRALIDEDLKYSRIDNESLTGQVRHLKEQIRIMKIDMNDQRKDMAFIKEAYNDEIALLKKEQQACANGIKFTESITQQIFIMNGLTVGDKKEKKEKEGENGDAEAIESDLKPKMLPVSKRIVAINALLERNKKKLIRTRTYNKMSQTKPEYSTISRGNTMKEDDGDESGDSDEEEDDEEDDDEEEE